jgi:hypothetical protein
MDEKLAFNFKTNGHVDILKLTPDGILTIYIDNLQDSSETKVNQLQLISGLDTYTFFIKENNNE